MLHVRSSHLRQESLSRVGGAEKCHRRPRRLSLRVLVARASTGTGFPPGTYVAIHWTRYCSYCSYDVCIIYIYNLKFNISYIYSIILISLYIQSFNIMQVSFFTEYSRQGIHTWNGVSMNSRCTCLIFLHLRQSWTCHALEATESFAPTRQLGSGASGAPWSKQDPEFDSNLEERSI